MSVPVFGSFAEAQLRAAGAGAAEVGGQPLTDRRDEKIVRELITERFGGG